VRPIVPVDSGGTVAIVKIPIACTLPADDAQARVEEWRTTLARVVVDAERVSPTELALRLRAGDRELSAVVDLVRREVSCCAFFEFALHVAAGATTLRVTVPADAAAVLDDFARLAAERTAS
jgi:hypothetical protein